MAALYRRYGRGRSGSDDVAAGLSLEAFLSFWKEQQPAGLVTGLDAEEEEQQQQQDTAGRPAKEIDVAISLFVKATGSRRGTLSIDAFQRLLLCSANSAVDPVRTSSVTDDMTRPINHYLIASSHNTYVTGNQVCRGEETSPPWHPSFALA